jgi:hypothetical protein
VRILNRTDLPDREIRLIVRRELAHADPGTVLVLERPPGSDQQGHVRYRDRRVRIWIAGTTRYPYSSSYAQLAGAPEYRVRDWREDLVATAAHEAYHLRAGANDRGQDEHELEAERRAVVRLELYRRRSRRGILERIRALV